MPTDHIRPNRLIHEKSPYLQQHAYNPVDWFPWMQEAFDRAKAEDKPLFVSIGYSTCHWCHVMEKESFEDDQVAKALNETFVCVKVDREERPDLDATYMEVCQAMGRSCGWPLNIIMTPNKNPFFVASYIPKDDRYGTVGLLNLIPQIGQIWKTRKEEMENIGRDVKEQIVGHLKMANGKTLDKSVLDDAYEQLFLRFDHEFGGFGRAPKFASPHNLLFLLRYYKRTKESPALEMVEKTLRFMRFGGIFDQVGLGFHRYSTDAQWLVPHFEKMLYDQAWLTLAYVEAYQATGAPKFKITAKETLNYVLRDLAAAEGGFYSAEDADSEGEEGKFYVWTLEEIKQALQEEDAELAEKIFDVKPEGNYYEPPKGRNGKNILHFAKPIEQLAQENNLTIDQFIGRLGRIVNELFTTREKRIHPSKDDKILVDWNGAMIAALARAGQVFGDAKYVESAKTAADFLVKEMWTNKGKLYHRYAKGEKAVCGFLDDYTNLAFGLIELYEATFDDTYLKTAIDLTKTMIEEFWDKENGGFFLTGSSAEETILRLKQTYDGAVPSGNSVALLNLLRLARLSGDNTFEEYASKIIVTFSQEIKTQPLGHTYMLLGLDFTLGPNYNVVFVAKSLDEISKPMIEALRKNYIPNLSIALHKPESSGIGGYEKIEGKPTVYICRNQTCMPPTNNIEKMLQYLDL